MVVHKWRKNNTSSTKSYAAPFFSDYSTIIETTMNLYTPNYTKPSQAAKGRKRKKLIKELKICGGDGQLLMFLTGPAGAGKSTAVTVARRFCFDFSMALGSIWTDSTFLFTAYTGSSVMVINGITICKAAFLCTDRALTEADK